MIVETAITRSAARFDACFQSPLQRSMVDGKCFKGRILRRRHLPLRIIDFAGVGFGDCCIGASAHWIGHRGLLRVLALGKRESAKRSRFSQLFETMRTQRASALIFRRYAKAADERDDDG
jgi:hypothetical protein